MLEADDEFYKSEQGQHYRLCRCFSVACPDGEVGDAHVSAIGMIITQEVFQRFKEKGWLVDDGDSLL